MAKLSDSGHNGAEAFGADVVMATRGVSLSRRLFVVVSAAALFLAACGSVADIGSDDPTLHSSAMSTPETSTTEESEAPESPAIGAFPTGASALRDVNHDSFPDPLVNTSEIISGGPPPDGIPPIDTPQFLDIASNLDLLPADEPVVALEINGDARAYPIRALVWHEIVNDTVGGVPVSVTYCPLCNSAATYERTIDGAETTFGTSGKLFASALVMYDRATESLWTHFNGTAVVGLLTGTRLTTHPSPLLAWSDFREAHPTGMVLDWTKTGFDRDYGRNPYRGYDDPENTPFLFRGALDDRAAAMQRIVGVEIEGEPAAYALDLVRDGEGKATNTTLGGRPLVIFWKSGQSSALDTSEVSGAADVGSAAVFLAELDGRTLTFDFDDGVFVDNETGSEWTITGEGVSGELEGSQLVRVPHLDTFWFAWSTYQPDTTLTEE
jgi:hypothetical protein